MTNLKVGCRAGKVCPHRCVGFRCQNGNGYVFRPSSAPPVPGHRDQPHWQASVFRAGIVSGRRGFSRPDTRKCTRKYPGCERMYPHPFGHPKAAVRLRMFVFAWFLDVKNRSGERLGAQKRGRFNYIALCLLCFLFFHRFIFIAVVPTNASASVVRVTNRDLRTDVLMPMCKPKRHVGRSIIVRIRPKRSVSDQASSALVSSVFQAVSPVFGCISILNLIVSAFSAKSSISPASCPSA